MTNSHTHTRTCSPPNNPNTPRHTHTVHIDHHAPHAPPRSRHTRWAVRWRPAELCPSRRSIPPSTPILRGVHFQAQSLRSRFIERFNWPCSSVGFFPSPSPRYKNPGSAVGRPLRRPLFQNFFPQRLYLRARCASRLSVKSTASANFTRRASSGRVTMQSACPRAFATLQNCWLLSKSFTA